jgi:hypothetical protein
MAEKFCKVMVPVGDGFKTYAECGIIKPCPKHGPHTLRKHIKSSKARLTFKSHKTLFPIEPE